MGLLDFIFKGRKPKEDKKEKPVRNLYVPSILDKWQYKRELNSDEDYSAFLNAYRNIVYTCVNKNASAVSSASLRLYVAKPNSKVRTRFLTKQVDSSKKDYIVSQPHLNMLSTVRKAIDFEEVLEHPVLDLMQKVNPFMSYIDLMERTCIFNELCGNSYWMLAFNKLGVPVEIWPMQPDNVRILPDEKNFIDGYVYGNGIDKVKFKEEEIIHFSLANPKSMYYGSSPLNAIRSSYNLTQSMYEYEINTFVNMGKIEGYWKVKDSLDETEYNRLKQELADSTQGVKNVNKSILVDSDMEYKYISITPREMAYLSGKDTLKSEIMMAFGQNEGLYDKGSTRANADNATYQFMKSTIKPRCQRIEQRLNEKLLPWWDDNLLFVYEDVVPDDLETMIRERESNIKNGLTTINEERKKMRMIPISGGDEVFMQMQMVPLSTILRGDNLKNNSDSSKVSIDNDK